MFKALPTWLMRTISVMVWASLIPLLYIAMLRQEPSRHPRLSIIPDMDKQQKFTAQASNPLFADGRAMRLYPVGTVPHDTKSLDEHLYSGIVNGQWAVNFPMPVTPELMTRGKRQYNIYCSPCHGLSGYGDGIIAKRAEKLANAGISGMTWVPPKSLQDPDTRMRPVGHIFNTITNGIRTMPPYGGQISVEDRWAIILYVRALQRSQNATLDELPAAEREKLLANIPPPPTASEGSSSEGTGADAAPAGAAPAGEKDAAQAGEATPAPGAEASK